MPNHNTPTAHPSTHPPPIRPLVATRTPPTTRPPTFSVTYFTCTGTFGSAPCVGSVFAPRFVVFSAQRRALVLAQRIGHRQLSSPRTRPHNHKPANQPLAQPQHTHRPPIHPSTTHPPTRYHPHTTHNPPTHVWFRMTHMYRDVWLSGVRWFCLRAAHSRIFGAAPCAGSSQAHRPPQAPPRQEPVHTITNQRTTHLPNHNSSTAHPSTHPPPIRPPATTHPPPTTHPFTFGLA
jgi:hypothetical protein